MKSNRIIYLDILRVLACCMVVLMHSPHPESGVPGYIQVPLYFLTAPCIGLFFMVSGALLLPSTMSADAFLKKRLGKIAGPWIFWTLFYLLVTIFEGRLSEISTETFVFLSPIGPHLWFMYVLTGLYLLVPILSPFILSASKKKLQLYLTLWGGTLVLPCFFTSNSGNYNPFYYFSGYVGYFVLGYYCHTYKPNFARFFIPILLIVVLVRYGYYLGGGVRGPELFFYLSVPVVLMSVAWFSLVQKTCENRTRWGVVFAMISNCSFGIYLVHMFVMRCVLWNIDFFTNGIGWVGQLMTSFVITLLISFVLTWLISFLPYSEYIVGFTNKKKK